METGSSDGRNVRFGAFEADLQAGELRKSGIRVRLQDQPFRVLALLLERSGEVVTREELRSKIWPDDTFVDFDHSLNTAINKIREALGDSASHPRFVETIPRRGYRFVFPLPRAAGKDGAEASVDPAAPGIPAARGILAKRDRLGWVVAAVAIVAALAVGIVRFGDPLQEPPSGPTVFSVYPPEGIAIMRMGPTGRPTISPDGQQVVFVGEAKDGSRSLWVRPLDSPDARPLRGTHGAMSPFWSPDSRQVAFFADGKLKRVPIDGANPRKVCDAPKGRGGAWSQGGSMGEQIILFSPDIQTGLYRVSPQGGEPRPVTNLSPGDLAHRMPTFLPDGEHFLYVLLAGGEARERQGIYLAKIDPGRGPGAQSEYKGRRLLEGSSKVAYVPPIPPHSVGYLLRVVDNNLVAQPFDAGRLKLTGKPGLVAESVPVNSGIAIAGFSASKTGNLVLSPPNAVLRSRLVWFDRRGRRLAVAGEPDRYSWVELSPDGKRVAFDVTNPGLTKGDIWVLDTVTGGRTLITSHPAFDGGPIWSPDGKSIISHSSRDRPGIYRIASTGVGDAEPASEKGGWVSDWSSNGKHIIYQRPGPGTRLDLWITRMDGDRGSLPYIEDEEHQVLGQFSPNGKYVAYASEESGRYEIYVQTFPATNERWLISNRGGVYPRWRGDGKELFYRAPDGTLMSVEIRTDPSFEPDTPTELFETRMAAHHNNRPRYDVAADGQRFLISTLVEEQPPQPLTVMLNWQARLEQ